MNCPNCQNQNPEGARFCSQCGAALAKLCSNCGTHLEAGARFCTQCGQPVEGIQVPSPSSVGTSADPLSSRSISQQPENLLERYIPRELLSRLESARSSRLMAGERRIVTILFCDVVGSTLAASQLDPEEWADIINGAFEFMIQPIYRYEGTVARLQGDGLLAFFGAPIAHEDDPQRAVLAALEIIKGLKPYSQEIETRWGLEFNVRVGINTGLVVVGEVGSDLRVEYTALGDAINMAARMEQLAEAGTVLVADPTYKLVEPLFDFKPIEGLVVKGREAPVTAFRALRQKESPGSLRGIMGLDSPLIGRQNQLDKLRSAAQDLKLGKGQIISVTGEAGLGKSRIIAEFHRELRAEDSSQVLWLEGRTLSYEENTPFAPFVDMLTSFFSFHHTDSDERKATRVKQKLAVLFPERAEEITPFIAALLNITLPPEEAERVNYLEPARLRALIFNQVRNLIERLSSSNTLVVYIDDLHWADSTSLELLSSLLPLTEKLSLMILVAYRPRRQGESWHFHEQAEREFNHRYQLVELKPLDQVEARSLVANLLAIDDLPKTVREKILEKSEGNPFFIEEVIRSLLDNQLVRRVNGHWQATKEIQQIDLPNTLVGVITTRLDQLNVTTKQVLQAASVLGREFSLELLESITELPGECDPALTELQRRELVREKNNFPQKTYIFKHVLTQEAAYNSILLSNRRELHLRAAEALIQRTPEAAGDIARHFLEARLAGKAVPYLVQAGDKAARAYATEDAIYYYRQALEQKSTATDLALIRRAYEGLGNTLVFANRFPEALEIYQEMQSLAVSSADIPMQTSALNKLAKINALYFGEFQAAEEILAQADELTAAHQEISSVPERNLVRCQICTAQADFENVVKYMDEVVQVGQAMDAPEHIAMGLEHVATSLVYLTEFDEALKYAEEALQIAREIGDRAHEAWLLSLALPMCRIRSGEFTAAQADLHAGLDIATKIGALESQIISSYYLSEIAHWQGDYERALKYGQISLDAGLTLEESNPFLLVPILGSIGMVYLEISEQFNDKIAAFHLHALRLLESPFGGLAAGSAWADLGLCAITLGDLDIAAEVIQKGLNHPNTTSRLERPRHLAGAALLASVRGEHAEALHLAQEAQAYAQERSLKHLFPLTVLILGKVLTGQAEHEASLEYYQQAVQEAGELGMKPLLWQAHAGAATALTALSRIHEANEARSAARAVIIEIADQFQQQELRAAYLKNSLAKIV